MSTTPVPLDDVDEFAYAKFCANCKYSQSTELRIPLPCKNCYIVYSGRTKWEPIDNR